MSVPPCLLCCNVLSKCESYAGPGVPIEIFRYDRVIGATEVVCLCRGQEGWNEQPPVMLSPRKHRELLRAVVSASLGISMCKVNLKALDSAYSIAFPHSTPLNVNKKKRCALSEELKIKS